MVYAVGQYERRTAVKNDALSLTTKEKPTSADEAQYFYS